MVCILKITRQGKKQKNNVIRKQVKKKKPKKSQR